MNPRSPCGERPSCKSLYLIPVKFQSTLPVWGATSGPVPRSNMLVFQSTLPVWGATIHREPSRRKWMFQSTLPVWGATLTFRWYRRARRFNPRSPCGERPGECAGFSAQIESFNPRSPCGERLQHLGKKNFYCQILVYLYEIRIKFYKILLQSTIFNC